jgi:glutaredoxin 3
MTETKEIESVVVWSRDLCPYCVKAKNLLEIKGIEYEERNISAGTWTREQLLEACPAARTVPQIVIDGAVIGGYDQLEEYFGNNDSK